MKPPSTSSEESHFVEGKFLHFASQLHFSPLCISIMQHTTPIHHASGPEAPQVKFNAHKKQKVQSCGAHCKSSCCRDSSNSTGWHTTPTPATHTDKTVICQMSAYNTPDVNHVTRYTSIDINTGTMNTMAKIVGNT